MHNTIKEEEIFFVTRTVSDLEREKYIIKGKLSLIDKLLEEVIAGTTSSIGITFNTEELKIAKSMALKYDVNFSESISKAITDLEADIKDRIREQVNTEQA